MFRRTSPAPLTILFDGEPVPAQTGESAAAALIAAGVLATRRTPATGTPRGAYCMMGACFDCLANVDGVGSVQLCLTPVRDGMRILTQIGARTMGDGE